jgi:ribosomal protein S18 acetylase RimI-like enzyme
MIIRGYQDRDAAALRRCVIVLQDFERTIDPRLLAGEEMADRYCERIHERCRDAAGQIYVAEDDSVVVGFVTVLARESFTELDDPPGQYALIADLVVLESQRGRGIGRQLLERAERHAKQAGATELRIGVLANNGVARRLYLDVGFQPHLEIFTKRW